MICVGVMNGIYPYWNPFTAACKSRDDRNNSSNSSNNNGASSNDNNGRRICEYVLWAVAFLCAIVVIGDLILSRLSTDDPRLDFQVNSLEVTSMKVYNISNDVHDQKHITADFYFNLTLKNMDKILMYFNPMQVSLEYDNDEFLSSTMLEPYLLLEDQRQLQFRMGIKDDAHLRNETVDSISQDLWDKNVLQFALKAQGNCVRWHLGVFQICGINLLCDDIKVGFPPKNNLTTGSMIVSPLLCNCNFDCHNIIR
ncbi:Shikimate dehydrogenase (NADP(+)) [Bienertia sinuspersici]